jgi:hypothetical protein
VGSNPTLSANEDQPPVRLLPRDLQTADPGDPRRSGPARSVPRWTALPVAAVLIAIVAFASRSGTLPTTFAIDGRAVVTAMEVAGYVGIAIGAVLLAVAILMFGPRARSRSAAQRKLAKELERLPLWARIVALVAVVALFAGQIAVVFTYLADVLRGAIERATTPTTNGSGGLDANALGQASPDFTALLLAFVIVVVLAILVLAYAIRLRLTDDRVPTLPVGDRRAAIAAEVSLDALRGEPDPRRAVIAAYAAMERSLSGAGLGRRRSEAPIEYLRRVLEGLTSATEEVRTLTHLFQFAKFSSHAVDEGMRSGAIVALEGIRSATGRPR